MLVIAFWNPKVFLWNERAMTGDFNPPAPDLPKLQGPRDRLSHHYLWAIPVISPVILVFTSYPHVCIRRIKDSRDLRFSVYFLLPSVTAISCPKFARQAIMRTHDFRSISVLKSPNLQSSPFPYNESPISFSVSSRLSHNLVAYAIGGYNPIAQGYLLPWIYMDMKRFTKTKPN